MNPSEILSYLDSNGFLPSSADSRPGALRLNTPDGWISVHVCSEEKTFQYNRPWPIGVQIERWNLDGDCTWHCLFALETPASILLPFIASVIGKPSSNPGRICEKLEFTDAAFIRSHGKPPRGRAGWLFQKSKTRTAFDRDLHGEIVCFSGTLTDAKHQAQACGMTGVWAILP